VVLSSGRGRFDIVLRGRPDEEAPVHSRRDRRSINFAATSSRTSSHGRANSGSAVGGEALRNHSIELRGPTLGEDLAATRTDERY
jgi:hypothetical protein